MNVVSRERLARWVPVPLRLIVGYGFMTHGFAKWLRGPGAFAATLHGLAVPWPDAMSWLTIAVELFGGLAVLLGAFIQIVGVPMVVVLLVAMFTVHLPYGFSSIKLIGVTEAGPQFGPPGYEVNLLYIACLVALMLGGPGPWAMEALFRRTRTLAGTR